MCRTNERGSLIVVDSDRITIMHEVYRIPVDQKELEELRERVKEFEDMPSLSGVGVGSQLLTSFHRVSLL